MSSSTLHQRFKVSAIGPQSSHLQDDLGDRGLDLLDGGHAWQLPIRRYGSSVIARCSCGHVSDFHLTAERLLGSRCERQELEIASRARAAMVGW
jgi:hypothetical protein